MPPEAFPAQTAPEENRRSVADPELYRRSLMCQRAIIGKLGGVREDMPVDERLAAEMKGLERWQKDVAKKFRDRLDADPDGSFTALVMAEDADGIIEALKERD